MKLHVKKGDTVQVLAGDDKGKQGRITKVDHKESRVFIEGINLQTKHTKPNAQNPNGGIVKSEGSVHISNVALLSEGKPTRIGRKEVGGKTVRFSKKTGKVLD
ncbi:MAG: 50S ribosomal protein L24 [Bacteroidetes bacterium 37-13]|nr:MAG: 50S ribosomal protein L24 [Bacteroidetes bacterium 37-13]